MAYTTKWFSEFDDESGENVYIVEVLDRDYSGSAIEVMSAGSPVKVQMMDVNNPFQVMRSLKFTFQWISDEESGFDISDLFITDDRKYKFQFSKYEGAVKKLLYTGYLVFVDCQEPFNSKPYPVTLSGTCSLPFIRDDFFLDEVGRFVEGKMSLIKIIANCLVSTGLDLPIHTHVNLFEQGMSNGITSSLKLAEIDTDGLRGKKGGEVLEGILGALNAFIVQSDGAWLIKGVREQESFLGQERRFDYLGNETGYALVNQSASFGRAPLNSTTPNVRPINGVEEFFAEPNSIATVTVAPGIAVNRLPNGTFSGQVLGGNLPGWVHNFNALQHPVAPGWTRSGSGRPDDPFKIDITGADTYGSSGVPSNIRIPSPIVINTGVWDEIRNRDSKVKLVISGAYRAADVSWFKLYIRLNDGDKDWAQFLDQNGTWQPSKKKQQIFYQVDVDVPANPPNTTNFAEAPLQTFEITTDKITDFLQRSGNSVAHFYFEVRAGYVTTSKAKFHFLNPRLTWEDFSVVITTETKFEGEHTYQVDAKFPIRNPNSAEHTIIIADKVGIETPEQRRPENRVMTGYMTLSGGSTLTQGWKRFPGGSEDPRDTVYEPIQKKCLRERIRLFCGKRRIIGGSFKGIGLQPHHSVFNRYDSLSAPDKFFTVYTWDWSPKEMEYNASFFELNFDPLANEVIELAPEGEGTRGNRMYSGAGGSSQSSGGATVKPVAEIALNDPEPFEYEILVPDEDDRVCDIGLLIESDHTPDTLEAKLLNYPQWLSEISLYRGEDLDPEDLPEGGILRVLWQGKPEKSGDYQILVELVASDGADYILSIPLVVEPSEDFIESWPPKFVDLPTLIFEKGIESTQALNIFDYLDPQGDHTGVGLSPKLLSKPNWITDSTIVFGLLSATGKPTSLGTELITYEISDAIGRTTNVPFLVKVVEPVKMVHELIGIGEIPGTYELPEEFQVQSTIEAVFDRWEATLKGGGSLGDGIDATWTDTDILPTFTSEAGQFVYEITLYRLDVPIKTDTISFVLYDEEYLAKVKAVVVKSGADIAELNLDGTTNLVNPETANLVARIEYIEHDEVVLNLDGTDRVYDELESEYPFFDEDGAISEGEHTFTVTIKNEGIEVEKRVYNFTVGDSEVKPEGGLKLVTFAAGTTNYTEIGELPISGGIFQLPPNYSILYEGTHSGTATWEFYKLTDGSFAPITLENPNRILLTGSKILIFGNKNSTQITGAHEAPVRFKVILTVRDQDGEISEILQSDFSFRIATLPGQGSALDLYHIGTGLTDKLIDTNVPKEGYQIEVPVVPWLWQLRFTKFPGGEEFDKIKSYFIKNNTIFLQGPGADGVSSFTDREYESPISDITNSPLYTFGFLRPNGEYETPKYPSGWESIIEPGSYEFRVEGHLNDVKVAETYCKFTLIEAVPEPPIKDCCAGGGSGDPASYSEIIGNGVDTDYIVTHNLNSVDIKVTIRKVSNGKEVIVENSAINANQVQVKFFLPVANGARKVTIQR